ncbi:neuferricin-like [Clytia hemisphaerica]|uniref:Cytochrome b5 heme-binding domain-containing protein n=1 Tax=Clytia hemisphaerica TaxID=252671 RepID=A0A7M5XN81_9CNID
MEEGKTNKIKFERRCPGIGEFLAYTSVVVVACAVIVPLELKYGYSSRVFNSFHMQSTNDDSVLHTLINILGLFKKPAAQQPSTGERIFTKEEIRQYSGEVEGKPIYLAYLGKVYDVTTGKQHYGKDGAYHFFAGKDASRAYVSGQFNDEGLIDDITGLPAGQYSGLKGWTDTFENKYPFVGKLEGFFYDSNGNEKEGIAIYRQGLIEASKFEAEEKDDEKKFPGCNSRYTPQTGHEIWCSTNSGAVDRDWTGYPRKFFKPGRTNFRCACVPKALLSDPRFKEFDGCPTDFVKCKLVQ